MKQKQKQTEPDNITVELGTKISVHSELFEIVQIRAGFRDHITLRANLVVD